MHSIQKLLVVSAMLLTAFTAAAQTQTNPDTPSFRVGAVIFTDFTYQSSPQTVDADGNKVHQSSFNVARAYINLTGNLNHFILFRITPDVARETGSGSSLSGSQDYRLKFAYAQVNLDDWTNKGSWARFGIQPTPYIEGVEPIYRYRFQGPTFVDREGVIVTSDGGLTGKWVFPSDYGSLHGGFYNGEGFNRAETNNEKSFQMLGSVHPFPSGSALLKGLRLHAFANFDHYVAHGERRRLIGTVTYEHPRANAGVDLVRSADQAGGAAPRVDGRGWDVWVTPKLPNHFELLLRHDHFEPDDRTAEERTRNIAGLAYWVPNLSKVSAAVMLDYDSLKQRGYASPRPDDTRYGVKMLINF